MKYKIQKFFKKDWRISQYFANNPNYYKQFGFAGHEGIDYATPNGTELYSPFDGVVVRDIDNPKLNAYGEHIVVWDPVQKIAMWFCHLQSNLVSQGDRVNRGQLLGYTDNTGNSSGPHCHVNFCETDATANRLNTNNGYKGFLDLLKYVELTDFPVPTEQVSPPAEPIPPVDTPPTPQEPSEYEDPSTIDFTQPPSTQKPPETVPTTSPDQSGQAEVQKMTILSFLAIIIRKILTIFR